MFANVTPAQLRSASGQMGGASEAQMDYARSAAQSHLRGAAGGPAASPPSTSASGNAAAAEVPADANADLEAAKAVKDQAGQDYR